MRLFVLLFLIAALATPGAWAQDSPDPRESLRAGLFDAEEAIWNLNKLSTTQPPEAFVGVTNSDLAFKDQYVFQGNYNGVIVWDISDPTAPVLVKDYLCPASQSDVSVYGNLMFVSGEGMGGRLDCGTDGVRERVSHERLRGIRIFDITDVADPQYVANVQTCRGSHTHSVLKDPGDDENIYVYVSGSAPVRPNEELEGCSGLMPEEDPNTALFRIEVIKVPLANPSAAAVVSSPRIFNDLEAPPRHGPSPADIEAAEQARAEGAFVVTVRGQPRVLRDRQVRAYMRQWMEDEDREGDMTAQDSADFRAALPAFMAARNRARGITPQARRGPTQCHDITLYPEIGLAGGACGGYGLLLDITDPANPVRIQAVADSNFSYWHSATFSNDGSKVLFTDEWGGGGGPKCRASDPMEWGANALFEIDADSRMHFKSYFKLPAAQSSLENCVAHNGSLIPVPGRDLFVQSWYQGGVSLMDWTDVSNPVEIAYHDRGPVNPERMQSAGSWSVYWYNGVIVSSEIARGLDIFELTPSEYLTANEIAASNTVQYDYFNAQGQPMYSWPASFVLARAYLDQLVRGDGLSAEAIAQVRQGLDAAEAAAPEARSALIMNLMPYLSGGADEAKLALLRDVLNQLAG